MAGASKASFWHLYTDLEGFSLLQEIRGQGIEVRDLIAGEAAVTDFQGIGFGGFKLRKLGCYGLLVSPRRAGKCQGNGLQADQESFFHGFSQSLSWDGASRPSISCRPDLSTDPITK